MGLGDHVVAPASPIVLIGITDCRGKVAEDQDFPRVEEDGKEPGPIDAAADNFRVGWGRELIAGLKFYFSLCQGFFHSEFSPLTYLRSYILWPAGGDCDWRQERQRAALRPPLKALEALFAGPGCRQGGKILSQPPVGFVGLSPAAFLLFHDVAGLLPGCFLTQVPGFNFFHWFQLDASLHWW
jgi:hypothetical protein